MPAKPQVEELLQLLKSYVNAAGRQQHMILARLKTESLTGRFIVIRVIRTPLMCIEAILLITICVKDVAIQDNDIASVR